jgi:hypothetical protein
MNHWPRHCWEHQFTLIRRRRCWCCLVDEKKKKMSLTFKYCTSRQLFWYDTAKSVWEWLTLPYQQPAPLVWLPKVRVGMTHLQIPATSLLRSDSARSMWKWLTLKYPRPAPLVWLRQVRVRMVWVQEWPALPYSLHSTYPPLPKTAQFWFVNILYLYQWCGCEVLFTSWIRDPELIFPDPGTRIRHVFCSDLYGTGTGTVYTILRTLFFSTWCKCPQAWNKNKFPFKWNQKSVTVSKKDILKLWAHAHTANGIFFFFCRIHTVPVFTEHCVQFPEKWSDYCCKKTPTTTNL